MDTTTSLKELSQKLVDEGKYNEAFPILKRAVQVSPEDGQLWSNLAWAALQIEKFNEAVDAYKQTIRITPHSD
ncbi:MAG: tetratricopeptide repeat protein [Candidatus Jettenia sp. CY-1]|nr:MAG: tetratricopeptide repeat protein [Candidatus Jettenia sp. CY-1]